MTEDELQELVETVAEAHAGAMTGVEGKRIKTPLAVEQFTDNRILRIIVNSQARPPGPHHRRNAAGSCPFDPFYELLANAPGLAMALREATHRVRRG